MLFILISLNVLCVSAQTMQPSTALQEAQKISAEVVKLFQQKKYDEALLLAQRAISIRENELGKNHISVAQAWRNLAYIQLQREKRKEAEKAFENGFEIYEKNQPLSPADEKAFAEMLEAVAFNDALNGNILESERKFVRAVELREKANGKDALETANALYKLAQIYELKLDYEKAAPLFLRSLDIKTKSAGKIDDRSREIYDKSLCLLGKLRETEQAEQLRERFFPQKPEEDSSSKSDENSTSDSRNKTVSGGVLNGRAIELPKPIYPPEAKAAGASGAVSVQVLIDEKGRIISACAVSGAREFHRVVEGAAYQSKFSPTTLEGKPVKVSGIITYNFVP